MSRGNGRVDQRVAARFAMEHLEHFQGSIRHMSDDLERIEEILDRYESLVAAGETPTVAQLCGDDRHLMSTVASRIEKLRAFAAVAQAPYSAPGTELPQRIGAYDVLEYLGGGGFGRVYLCQRHDPPGRVAVKVLGPRATGDIAIERFVLEKKVLASLHHPNIAQIYDAGSDDIGYGPVPFLVMEYIPGQRLNLYADEKLLPIEARLKLLAAVCEAIAYAHKEGVVHRDLKPANVLVDEWGEAKVIDFGIAKIAGAAGDLTKDAGGEPGTPAYMSPEQVDTKRFGAVDGRADVYALGVIGYQLVTGRLPYEADYQSPVAIARAVTDEEPLPPARIDKRLRGDLSTILLKALEKEPARRYQTADEMAADLTRYLERRPIAARPSGAVYRAKRFAQRNPGLVGGVTAAFAALLLGLIGTATGLYSASTARRETRLAAADLAMYGGNWPKAMQYIDAPTTRISLDDLPELLTRIKAADYAEDVAEADRFIRLARESLRDAAPAELDLAEANLLLSASADFDSALTLVDRAKTKGLAAPADRHYVDGLLAKTTPQALAAFQRAIEADSRHFPAQRAALVCRFFLGQHDKVLQQSEVVRNLFPNESLGRQLAIVSGAFLPGPYGEHPRLSELADMLGKINPLADETDVLGLIDMGAQLALKDKADANSWALFHAAIQPMQDATKKGSDSLTPLQNVFSGGSRVPVDVSFATRYVPVIARARSEVDAVMTDYQAANYAADKNMVDRMEAALKKHPESTMYLVAGSMAVSLPQGSVSEMARNVERSQSLFQKGAENFSIIPEIPIDSRVWAIMGQHALGRPGRQHDKPDLAMRDKALENVRWLQSRGVLPNRNAAMLSGFAAELGDPVLARDVAQLWSVKAPKHVEAILTLGRAELALENHAAAIKAADRVLLLSLNNAEAAKLREDAIRGAAEFAAKAGRSTAESPAP